MAYNLVGQRFGKLFVEKQLETDSHGERKWLCICDCGNKHEVTSYNLVHEKTTRCAICSNKAVAEKQFVHGRKPTHLFNCFANMNTRCYNPNYYLFQHYGGKGIKVCDEWRGKYGFINFRKWAFENGYKEGLSIDRIDNSKSYCPENCRWVTMTVQQNNRTNNRVLTINGTTDTMANWSKKSGIPYSTIQQRLKRGWSEQEAISIEVGGKR